MRKEVVQVWADECDCLERYGKIMHNDGGNYHSSTTRYKYTVIPDDGQIYEVLVDVTESSRDFYYGETIDLILVLKPGEYTAVLIEGYDPNTDTQYIRDVLCYKDDSITINNVTDGMKVLDKVVDDYYNLRTIVLDSWVTDSSGITTISLV